MQTVLVPKHIFMYCDLLVKTAWKKKWFEGRTSLCFTDQKAQEEILLGGPTHSWVSTYTHLLYKAQDLFSACRQSWFLNTFVCTAIYWWKLHEKKKPFKDRTSLCLTDQEAQKEILLGGPTPSWVSTSTHLQCKCQDLFSVWRQSCFLNKFYMYRDSLLRIT